jgi:large subunit ribosomal protein L4
MKVPVYNISGERVEEIEVRDDVFAVPINRAVVHQALVRQRANARLGSASTKTRGQVAGSTRKLFRQKHTGRARQGGIRAPHRRGGGVAFGPHPRSYRQAMPKKMRRLALRCVLSSKLAEGELKVVQDFPFQEPKTKQMAAALQALGVNSSALIVTGEVEPVVVQSARNLERIKTLPAALLNVADLLSARALLMTVAAVRKAEGIWGLKPVEEQVEA